MIADDVCLTSSLCVERISMHGGVLMIFSNGSTRSNDIQGLVNEQRAVGDFQ